VPGGEGVIVIRIVRRIASAARRAVLGISPDEIRYTFEDVRRELRAARRDVELELEAIRKDLEELGSGRQPRREPREEREEREALDNREQPAAKA
jgi:hypothetical protein